MISERLFICLLLTFNIVLRYADTAVFCCVDCFSCYCFNQGIDAAPYACVLKLPDRYRPTQYSTVSMSDI